MCFSGNKIKQQIVLKCKEGTKLSFFRIFFCIVIVLYREWLFWFYRTLCDFVANIKNHYSLNQEILYFNSSRKFYFHFFKRFLHFNTFIAIETYWSKQILMGYNGNGLGSSLPLIPLNAPPKITYESHLSYTPEHSYTENKKRSLKKINKF